MPTSLSAMKRVRQNLKSRARNRAVRSKVRGQLKVFRAAVAAGDASKAQEECRQCVSLFDRAATKGVIHRRTAARNKARMAAALNGLLAQPPAE